MPKEKKNNFEATNMGVSMQANCCMEFFNANFIPEINEQPLRAKKRTNKLVSHKEHWQQNLTRETLVKDKNSLGSTQQVIQEKAAWEP